MPPRDVSNSPTRQEDVMEKKSLFDQDVYDEIRERLDRLNADSEGRWGSMTVAQMLGHCAEVIEVSNGKKLEGTPFFVKLFAPVVKWMILSEKPFPKMTRTHPQYEYTEPHDFQEQKDRLIQAIDEFRAGGPAAARHPVMGKMTPEERGWGNYKHLDHHLHQFGV
jgi:hypothetical protein